MSNNRFDMAISTKSSRGYMLLRGWSFILIIFAGVLLSDTQEVFGGGDPVRYEIDIKELVKVKKPDNAAPVKKQKQVSHKPAAKTEDVPRPQGGASTYIVKPGDYLFKILMRDFGMSNSEAESHIPEVVRINNLSGSTKLTVGSRLVIHQDKQVRTGRHKTHYARKHNSPQKIDEQEAAPVEVEPPVTAEAAVTPEPPAVTEVTETVPVIQSPLPLSIKSIAGGNLDQTLDNFLTAIALPWNKDRVIEGSAGSDSPESFSIKVERYLELDGRRYVLTSSRQNPYEYTVLRLLELAGYSVIRLDDQSGVPKVIEQLLTQFGFTFSSGRHRFTLPDKGADPRIIDGFLVTVKNPASTVFLTETPLDALSAEMLASSTVEPYKESSDVVAP